MKHLQIQKQVIHGCYKDICLTLLATVSIACSSNKDADPEPHPKEGTVYYSVVNIGGIRNDGSITGVGFLLEDGTDRIYVQQEGGRTKVEFLTDSFIDADDEVKASGNIVSDFLTDSDVVIKITEETKVTLFKPGTKAVTRVGHDLNHSPTNDVMIEIASRFTEAANDASKRAFTALQ